MPIAHRRRSGDPEATIDLPLVVRGESEPTPADRKVDPCEPEIVLTTAELGNRFGGGFTAVDQLLDEIQNPECLG
jgi:hypothetical protein